MVRLRICAAADHFALLPNMRLHFPVFLSALMGTTLAANFTVVVNGTASHPVPETLCKCQSKVLSISIALNLVL